MNIDSILIIIAGHMVCDFILQDEAWATTKSHSVISLSKHVATYSTALMPFAFLAFHYQLPDISYIQTLQYVTTFSIVSFIAHFATDFITSKIVARKFAAKEYGSAIPNLGAFSIIGFDQLLHYVQLFVTFHEISCK